MYTKANLECGLRLQHAVHNAGHRERDDEMRRAAIVESDLEEVRGERWWCRRRRWLHCHIGLRQRGRRPLRPKDVLEVVRVLREEALHGAHRYAAARSPTRAWTQA